MSLSIKGRGRVLIVLLILAAFGANLHAYQVEVRPISPPRTPLPPEAASAGITKFSYIVYGDTRGRRDGADIQYEHSLVVDSAIATIKRLEHTDYPVKFVLQTGDAVLNGQEAQQWNVSFVSLINRITVDGGVPYFLVPGNHDVTNSTDLNNPGRVKGLDNFLKAIGHLIPPEGSPRRLSGYPTYAFGYGNLFAIGFDSIVANDEKQFEWIKHQLESLDRKRYTNVIVFCHQAAFSSGPHGGGWHNEPQTTTLRTKYMPLFRQYHVSIMFCGHEHLFEHWVERYQDGGKQYRFDQILTGAGGAPLYAYQGEPDLRDYLRQNQAQHVTLEHLVKPGMQPGDNPYHYLVVKVDGNKMSVDVIGVDWGSGFQPYRSRHADLGDPE
ncbi:MAG TPA: metallophosphoesterase [Blastocatellia bacterium]|nr:metallophosphoesterase [Blastocatellia bacterium]